MIDDTSSKKNKLNEMIIRNIIKVIKIILKSII